MNRAQRAAEMSEVGAFKDVASLAYMNALTDKEKGQVGIYNVTIDDIIEELTKSYNIITIENGTVELATSDEDTNIELLAGETVNKRVITSKDSTTNYVELKGKYYKFYLKNGKIEVDEGLKERQNATNDYSFTATSSDESLAKVTVTPESTSNFTIQISGEGETTSGSPAVITVSYGGSSVQINVTVKACNLLIKSESETKGTVAVTSNSTPIGTNKYKKGTSVTLEAIANTGYIFGGWYRVTGENENITENLISSENPYTFTIENVNETIKAKYNEATLIQGFVDDLGTRAMIYLYANPDVNDAGDTITIKDSSNNYLVDVDGTSRTTGIKAVAKNTNGDGKFEITGTDYSNAKQYYIAYPVTQNGEYTFSATKTKNGVTSNSTITVSVENIERFTAIETLATNQSLTSEDNGQKSYNYKGAVVPKGYYVDANSNVDMGLVITDAIDSNGYSIGNEWVWIPVVEDSSYQYHLTVSPAEKMYGSTSVIYTNYSKLWKFTTDQSKDRDRTTFEDLSSPQAKPSKYSYNIEPCILVGHNGNEYDAVNYKNVYNRKSATKEKLNQTDGIEALAIQFRDDYDKTIESINKYRGFYIGRYEITTNGEKYGVCLTEKTWYELYNKCMYLNKEPHTETSMIYGALWDATMKWLADYNYNIGYAPTGLNRTSGYGNYYYEEISVSDSSTSIIIKKVYTNQKLMTGQISYTKSNNIYDLSGNCYDWTQEANPTAFRVMRGGCFKDDMYNTCSSSRKTAFCTASEVDCSARAQLYIK